VAEDAEVDGAGAVPCFRMDWGLAAGGVFPVCRVLETDAAVLAVGGSGEAAAA